MVNKVKKFWESLGPGLITGAADNDPSGVASYSIAGAQFGVGLLWVVLWILPFMIAIQDMCARIGALSGRGLAGNIKRHYPMWILLIAVVPLLAANIFNIGADIYGMAGAVNLLVPVPIELMAIVMAIFITVLVIVLRYRTIERIFKWFAVSLLLYGAALFLVRPDWPGILWHTLVPTLHVDHAFILTLFALFGTTISPYLFFWQASQEAEDVHMKHPGLKVFSYRRVPVGMLAGIDRDNRIGMISSNIVSFFIIALAASTLHTAGATGVTTLREAATALQPLAGPYAFALFSLGLIGSGLLAVPVLAGSAAYVVSEMMGWPASLDMPFHRARQFYLVMVFSVLLGMFLPFIGISPIQALFWAAILNGLIAPPLIMLVMHMASNSDIVGKHRSHPYVHGLAMVALVIVLTGSIYVLFS